MAKEYRIKVSVRNNLLLRAIEEAGFTKVAPFERANGFRLHEISDLIRLQRAPIDRTGEFSDTARRLMECLGAAPSDLWSDEQLYMEIKRSTASAEVGAQEIRELLYQDGASKTFLLPDSESERTQLTDVVSEALASLTKKEAAVLRLRFHEDLTFDEVAKRFDVTRERIRQIEAKALRKLRHPLRSEKLRTFLSYYETECQENKQFRQRRRAVNGKVLKNEQFIRWPAPRLQSEGKYMPTRYGKCPTIDTDFDNFYRIGMAFEIASDEDWDLYVAWRDKQACDTCGLKFSERSVNAMWLRERDCGCSSWLVSKEVGKHKAIIKVPEPTASMEVKS